MVKRMEKKSLLVALAVPASALVVFACPCASHSRRGVPRNPLAEEVVVP
jgi:hypothetical protein